LAQILDTMQEGRFDFYMKELGGFTDEDTDFFVNVCLDYIDFYCSFFQRDTVVVPLSTLISHFVIYKKLIGYYPGFQRLLELGPGCGYLSFFLRHHAPLVDYTQIESTESFYLLQSHINSHVFGSRFAEHAVSRHAVRDHGAYVPKLNWHNPFHYEEQNIISVETQPVCNHFPWWRIGEVARRKYDIVTSNANLNEFSREALFQYLSLIRDVLDDDGVIVAQCLGGGPPTYDTIFANMKSAGFIPVALIQGVNDPGRVFVVSNAVFVGEKHPLFAKYADVVPQFPMIDRGLDFVDRMYFLNESQPERKRVRTIQDMLFAILEEIDRTSIVDDRAMKIHGVAGSRTRASLSANLRAGNRLRRVADLEGAEPEETENPEPSPHRDTANRWGSWRADAERKRLTAEVEALTKALVATRTSTSWKVTAPLRALSR
ncbi:MAG: hypothetical protein ACRD2A_17450, partial [Vicinamibacterales bacterium]